MTMNIKQILVKKYPGTEWVLNGNTYDGLDWLDESPKPTEEELFALWPEVQFQTEVNTVETQRKSAYQSEADPLFFKWQAGDGTEEEWLAKRTEIAERFPYPVKEETTPEPTPEVTLAVHPEEGPQPAPEEIIVEETK